MTKGRHEKGAALIVVLMLVGTLSALALALTQVMTRTTNRAAASSQRDAAVWALLGAEEAALVMLKQQAALRPRIDTPDERWLAAPITLPVDAGLITVSLFDRSACINVNDLVMVDPDQGQLVTNASEVQRFGTFLAQLGGDVRSGENLASAAADFMDTDDRVEPGGAEDYNYTGKAVPYLTSGTWMADISELRAVEGWTGTLYRALAPHLCARPANANSDAINVNTLKIDDAPVLYALFNGRVSQSDLERLIEQRPPAGYENVSMFLEEPVISQLNPPLEEDITGRLSTEATYIEMSAQLAYQGQVFEMLTMIELEGTSTYKVVSRRFGARDL